VNNYGLPPGISPYSNLYGFPGFDVAPFVQFKQFQASKLTAASSTALSESKIIGLKG
jgi:hypothetical protein